MANPQPNKPTKEELEEKQRLALEADPDEKSEDNPEDKEEELDDKEEEKDEKVDDNQDKEREEEEESDEEDKGEEDAEPSKELYKKKFSESSREAQRINAKNRIINKAIQEAEDIPEPTEEEMKKQYGDDWDLMSDVDKTLIKETEINRRWRTKIKEASDQAVKIEKWDQSVNEFVEDPKTLNQYPDLEGKTEAFKEFASVTENNNVPFKILVGAFLHESSSGKTSNKGSMFIRGKGGSKENVVNDGSLSLEEARKLRETDYPKYKEKLMAGKIKLDI